MIPKILEYEDGDVKITAEAFIIPELNAIIKKYGDDGSKPYLAYVHGLSYPTSIYVKLSEEDKEDSAIYDIKSTIGDFDHEDPLLEKAIKRLKSEYETELYLTANELEAELRRWRIYLRDNPIDPDNEAEMKFRMNMVANIGKYSAEVAKVRKEADEELAPKMRGNAEMGEY